MKFVSLRLSSRRRLSTSAWREHRNCECPTYRELSARRKRKTQKCVRKEEREGECEKGLRVSRKGKQLDSDQVSNGLTNKT